MAEGHQQQPNFVVILADDMGFSDIGCFGSEIRTPNLDRMARRGLRFTQMYNCARCCPTRASLLTGLYPHQAGVGLMVGDSGLPSYQGYLRRDCVTIGEVLQAAGYRTCYAGKWHVSPGLPIVGEPAHQPGSERNPTPRSRGFQDFYGTLAGCGNFFHPHGLMAQDSVIEPEPDYYYTDTISDRACRMVESAADGQAPFFLHVCYTAPHWPLHARPADIARYRGRYRAGWDDLRTARHEEQKGMGLLNPDWPISPRDTAAPDFAAGDARGQEWEDLRMAVYAAQIDSMDQGIGRILDTLAARQLEDNTIVIFLSDNGGCAEFLNEDGDDRTWPGMYRHTAPPGQTCTVGNIAGLEPGPATTFMSYDLPWANASNTPFRMYKHWVHEGGISTPMVCQWPATAAAGGIVHQPCHVIDIMATCLDAARVPYPAEFGGRAIQSLAGESFLPLLQGQAWHRERPLFWEHHGNRAVREGQWKLVAKTVDDCLGPWELYDLAADRTELQDLAHGEPGRVQRLSALYQEWADRCGVVPWQRGIAHAISSP